MSTSISHSPHGQLENADALFKAITTYQDSIHQLLASRALVRARLQLWDEALLTFTPRPSISSQPVTHWVYCKDDIAFEHFHSSHLGFLLLTKAIIVFMAGEHPDAISPSSLVLYGSGTCTTCYHAANIATDVFIRRTCIFLLETRRWNAMTTRVQSIRSRARAQMQGDISGWEFDLLDILIRQGLCEALYALGRTMELLWTKSLQDCTHHQTLPNNVSRASKTLVSQLRTHSSMSPIPLLREWEKATLFVVPRFTT
ncbi:hypothetical protein EV363DRAFT_1332662 [Boletus edulis]|nr:hypothetical protein EV363DRAFT_1332662 [Boletus edulis]